MKIALYSRLLKPTDVAHIQEFLAIIERNGDFEVSVYAPYLVDLQEKISIPFTVETFDNYTDLVQQKVSFLFSLGGDGTILDTPSLVRDSNIPLVGVNLGRLGFLSSIEKQNFEQGLKSLQKGDYTIENRTLLQLENSRGLFGDKNFALNDCTISKRDTSSMIIVHSYIDGKFLNSYWADGLIVATPTGSTGYSLSCGGPIIAPSTGNFVITPVAPHNLNVRPIIVDDNSEIQLEIEGRAAQYLCTLDSRFQLINNKERIIIRKNPFSVKLVRLEDIDFYQTIRSKLAWGVDTRNFKTSD